MGIGTVLRGEDAGEVGRATFGTDFSTAANLPAGLLAAARAEARAAGYAAGWAEGRAQAKRAAETEAAERARAAEAAEAARAETAARAVAALGRAAARLEGRVVPVAAELEDQVVRAAFQIAEAIVGRELATAADPGGDALARALALAPAGPPVTVRLHPADHAALTGGGDGRIEADGRTVTLVADADLRPGDATAECEATAIDARLESALRRVEEALGL
ncbi:FliH/SctL family protein [Spirillospora sp. CA-253888]